VAQHQRWPFRSVFIVGDKILLCARRAPSFAQPRM